MVASPQSDSAIRFEVEGRTVTAPTGLSIIQAVWEAGITLVEGIGCLGQGACGSCRVFVRRSDESEVRLMLACETLAEDGMQVSFAHFIEPQLRQRYQLEDFQDTWSAVRQVAETFPEAAECRHCGGCDESCPRDISVEEGVKLAAGGKVQKAGALFDECIMCNLCTLACPEYIAPNHLAQLCRRASSALLMRPANLMQRLTELERGELVIEDAALEENADPGGGGPSS